MIVDSKKFIQFNQPDISEREIEAVSKVMRSGWLGNGPVSRIFEDRFSSHVYYKPCVAVNSCTMGLLLALRAENIDEFDHVITTPLTFAATANAIFAVGARPIFVDVDEHGLMNPNNIESRLTKNTKAIIPVHLGGSPCDMDAIMAIARKHGLKVIEDAAHAFGGSYKGKPLGSIGDYGVFSFYPTKNITTAEGGMVVCSDKAKQEKIRIMASQGLTSSAWMRYGRGPLRDYSVVDEGYKGAMPDILAAIGLVQLDRWKEIQSKRATIFRIYERAFGRKKAGHSQHLYSIYVKDRLSVRKALHEKGIGTGIHYNPLHLEPVYGYEESLPMAEKMGAMTLSLPLNSMMDVEDAHYVVETVENIIN